MSDILVLENSFCRVEAEEGYFSEDTINFAGYETGSIDSLMKVVQVRISTEQNIHTLSIAGSYLAEIGKCAVLEDNFLILNLQEQLFKIDICTGAIVRYAQIDIHGGGTFGLYRAPNGYIIHGEIEIIMVSAEFEVVWRFSGRDIFVSITGRQEITLTDNTIQLFDFEDNFYEIDYQGRPVSKQTDS